MFACALPLAASAGCSVVLDWNGYTGGESGDDSSDADARAPADAPSEAASCASTCGGCCDELGQCEPGTTTGGCGTHGAACATCGAGHTCASGACVTSAPVDSGPTCTDDGCKLMMYSCGSLPGYTPQPCCQSSGVCGCTPNPIPGTSSGICGPRPQF